MKEKDVLRVTTDMLDRLGWRWWHVPAPMVAGREGQGWRPYRKAAGLPDIFAFHEDPPRMVILELKGDRGRLSDEQREFLRLARDVADEAARFFAKANRADRPFGVYVVEPGNLDTLEQILKSKVLA